jgi:hypothetical protein
MLLKLNKFSDLFNETKSNKFRVALPVFRINYCMRRSVDACINFRLLTPDWLVNVASLYVGLWRLVS